MPSARVLLFAAGATALVVLAFPAFADLPSFGEIDGLLGDALVPLAVEERATANTVTAILFDMRAIDTLGEESILFAAVLGTSLLLRLLREEREHPPQQRPRAPELAERSPAISVVGVPLVGLVTLIGFSLLAQGHVSPGGGFQGGVLLAGAALLIYLLHDYDTFDLVADPERLEPIEGLAMLGYVAVGLAGLASASAFLVNVLPYGSLGTLPSGGTIPVLNVISGVAVASGIGVVLAEFAEQALRVRGA